MAANSPAKPVQIFLTRLSSEMRTSLTRDSVGRPYSEAFAERRTTLTTCIRFQQHSMRGRTSRGRCSEGMLISGLTDSQVRKYRFPVSTARHTSRRRNLKGGRILGTSASCKEHSSTTNWAVGGGAAAFPSNSSRTRVDRPEGGQYSVGLRILITHTSAPTARTACDSISQRSVAPRSMNADSTMRTSIQMQGARAVHFQHT